METTFCISHRQEAQAIAQRRQNGGKAGGRTIKERD